MKSQNGYLTQKSNAWLGHYSTWHTDPRTGERKRRQRSFRIAPVSMSKTEARGKLRERIAAESGVTADGRLTVAWFIENRWKPLHEGNWRDSTKAVNKELLKPVIDRFGKTPIEDMDSVEMQRWLADLAKRKSGSLVRHCRIFLRSVMSEATEQEYCRKNPARLLRVPRLKPVRKVFLTLPEVKALLKAAIWQPRDRALLRLILVTALRPSELLALKWRDIDFKAGTMTLRETVYRGVVRLYTKTSEEGELPRLVIPEPAVMALVEWHAETERNAESDYLFPNENGGFLHSGNYQKRVLKELGQLAGIKEVSFRILRRTVSTHAQALGSPRDIATLMRHKKVQLAQDTYIQAIESTVRETGERLAVKMLTK